METRKDKFKAYVKSHSKVIIVASASVLTVGIAIAVKVVQNPSDGTSDGVPDELWDEMLAVAKKMDTAVAEQKARNKE